MITVLWCCPLLPLKKAASLADDEERQTHLQMALSTFEFLAGSCPMTPLRWMQYAQSTFQFYLAVTSTSSTNQKTSSNNDCTEEEEDNDDNLKKEKEEQKIQGALSLRLSVLELGLLEFPGSALLHLHR